MKRIINLPASGRVQYRGTSCCDGFEIVGLKVGSSIGN